MSRKDTRLNGLNPLAYMGVDPYATPLVFTNNRQPTVNDKKFDIGTFWINRETLDIWVLVDLASGTATWIRFATSGVAVLDFITDAGTANAVASILNWLGDGATDTVAAGNGVTTDFIDGAAGQIYIGDGITMALANITSTGGTLTITNGANTINIEDPGIAGINEIDGDVGTAIPIGGIAQVLGGTNITTVANADKVDIDLGTSLVLAGTLTISALGAGVSQTTAGGIVGSSNGSNGEVLIGGGTSPLWTNITSTGASLVITNGANSINIENPGTAGIGDIDGDTGNATPIGGNVKVLGGTNITTAAAGNTLTINLDNNVTLSGTLTLSPLTAGVMQTDAAGLITSSVGTNGQLLISSTAGVPAWANITSTGATIDITNGDNTINIEEAGGVTVDDTLFNAYQPKLTGGFLPGTYDVFGDSTEVSLGIALLSTIFDPGSNVTNEAFPEDFRYTAPEDGKYNFQTMFSFYGEMGILQDGIIKILIITSNRTFEIEINTLLRTPAWGAWVDGAETLDVCLDLDAADIVNIKYVVDIGRANTLRIDSSGATIDLPTFASGFYIGA